MSQEPAPERTIDADENRVDEGLQANGTSPSDQDETSLVAEETASLDTGVSQEATPDSAVSEEHAEEPERDSNPNDQDLGFEGEEAPSEIIQLIRKARSTTVSDMNDCGDAGQLIRELTQAVKQTKEDLAPLKTRFSSAKIEFQEAEKSRLKPLVEAEKLVKSSIEAFLTEESARRRHKRELEEASRQETIAEREQKIQVLEEQGKVEEARSLADEYPPELPPAPPLPVPQTIATKASRRSEVNDLQALIRYVAEHPEHADLLRPATPTLNAMARRTKGDSPIPGVAFLTEQKVTTR